MDVRFFGLQHERSLVPLDKCFCLSEYMPNNVTIDFEKKHAHLKDSWDFGMSELITHIIKLENEYDCVFKYAPVNTKIDFVKQYQYLNKYKSKLVNTV